MAGNILVHPTGEFEGADSDYSVYRALAQQVADGTQESFMLPMGAIGDGSTDVGIKIIRRGDVPEFLTVWNALHSRDTTEQPTSEFPTLLG